MAKTAVKKISINKMDEIVKKNYVPETVVEWHDSELHVKSSLGFEDMFTFVNFVVDKCFDEETGEYHPEFKDVFIRYAIVKMYSNVNMPEDFYHAYDILTRSGIVEEVMRYINPAQLDQMVRSIDLKIKHMEDANIAAMNARFEEVISSIEAAQGNLNKIMGDVTEDDVKNLIGAISSGSMSADDLVGAYIDKTRSENKHHLEVVEKEGE